MSNTVPDAPPPERTVVTTATASDVTRFALIEDSKQQYVYSWRDDDAELQGVFSECGINSITTREITEFVNNSEILTRADIAARSGPPRSAALRTQAENIIDSVLGVDAALYDKKSSDRYKLREQIASALLAAHQSTQPSTRSEGEAANEVAVRIADKVIDEFAGCMLVPDGYTHKGFYGKRMTDIVAAELSASAPADEVERALTELREMFPEHAAENWIEISAYHDAGIPIRVRVELGANDPKDKRRFEALTLDLVMQAIREYKKTLKP